MENETTEINYWQRARINLNLAKSRQLLRVHAEERRLGRCRFMHMPRRRRLHDWDKITSGCTRCSPHSLQTPSLTPPPVQWKSPLLFTNHPYRDLPLLIRCLCSISSRRLHHRHTNIAAMCIYSNRLHADSSYTTLSPRRVRVYAADKSSVLMCARKGYRCTRTHIRYVYKVMCERVYIRARRENKYRDETRAKPKR